MTQFTDHHPPRSGNLIWERVVPSRPDCKAELVASVMVILVEDYGWVCEDEAHWLELCLEEVVINAMVHGNQGDPNLMITCEIFDDQDHWTILMMDQGDGFCPADLPDPEDPESLLLEHGRGILLMEQWLSKLEYYQGGRCAWLSRHKDGSVSASPDTSIESK